MRIRIQQLKLMRIRIRNPEKMFIEGNQIHNFMSSSGSDFLTSYGSGSASQKVTVPTVPVPVPQHWI
jgi:hypothetical protein